MNLKKPAAKLQGYPILRPLCHDMCCFKGCNYVGYKLKNNACPEHYEAMKRKNSKQRTDHKRLKMGNKFSGFPFEHQRHPYFLSILDYFKPTILPALRITGQFKAITD